MSLKISVNFFLNLCTNLVNFNSSLVISVDLPKLNPVEDSNLLTGTFKERYNFALKYSKSATSPKFWPPGNVSIVVPLPPSLLGNQKSSNIDI